MVFAGCAVLLQAPCPLLQFQLGLQVSRDPSLLLLYSLPGKTAGTVSRHLEALETVPGFRARALNLDWSLPAALDLGKFDIILIHYSLMASEDAKTGPLQLSHESVARIGAACALKGVFIQDEHRNVCRTIETLKAVGTDILFTCVPPRSIETVYPESALPGVVKVNVLTGYVDPQMLGRPRVPYTQRRIDVGYRARKVPFWLGQLAREKWSIASRFEQDAKTYSLDCDISTREEDRIYGEDWWDFLSNCKAILGTESGASAIDFDGTLRAAVDAAVAAGKNMEFEEIASRYLAGIDGNISMAQISPRCFEAAAARTLMILYEGDYSGRLKPWRHYVPLRKDHSNMAEAVAVLRDEARAAEIIAHAYEECALAPENSYAALQNLVRDAVLAARPELAETGNAAGYDDAAWVPISAANARMLHRVARFRRIGQALTRVANSVLPNPAIGWLNRRVLPPLRRAMRGL